MLDMLELLKKKFEDDLNAIFDFLYEAKFIDVKEDGCVIDQDNNYYGNIKYDNLETIIEDFLDNSGIGIFDLFNDIYIDLDENE